MKSILVFFIITAATIVQEGYSHTYHTGRSCENVEPLQGFEMRNFLGIWYAIQKTSTASTCIVYNITRGEEPGEYLIEQTSQHFALGLTPLKHEYSYTGELTVKDMDVPAKMTVNFPLSVAGSSSFTVFITDYDNYAGVFSCQRLGIAHRRSATILSRTRTLDRAYVDKIRTRLGLYQVNPFDLSIIDQTGCPRDADQGVNIHIDPDTLSAQNIGNVFKKAGEKIGDGVTYVVDGGKKIYHNLADREETTDRTTNSRMTASNTYQNDPEPDAEWVRL